tara:strand:+ start:1168 stop:1308 length:141 start_codon:yes stop_codon:yes gene_type:complete
MEKVDCVVIGTGKSSYELDTEVFVYYARHSRLDTVNGHLWQLGKFG